MRNGGTTPGLVVSEGDKGSYLVILVFPCRRLRFHSFVLFRLPH